MADQLASSPLPASADVVVIGGGVNGVSTAFNLTRAGVRDVVLLERRQLGAGASGKSGALVRAHYTNVPETLLTHASMQVFRNWQDVVGHGDAGYEETGFVRVVAPEDSMALRANVDAMREEVGVETWIVDRTELREIEPLMRTDDLEVAAFEPHAGYCDPNGTLYGFAEAAVAGGARIVTNAEALAIERDGRGITGVRTASGTIATRTVVLAAGAYADRLLAPLGWDLGLAPWRSQVVIFRWPSEMDQKRRHRVVIDSTQHSWFRVEGANTTLIGAETGDRRTDPETFGQSIEPDYVDHARRALAARFPIFKQATMRGGWSGVYMHSPDDHPIIDQLSDIPGLFVMAGDSGTSFKTSPAIGQCLSEWITTGAAKLVDLTPFRASRFAEGAHWVDEFAYDHDGADRTIAR